MERYSTNRTILKRFDGKRYIGTTIYPPIKESDSDLLYISTETDYLDTLSYKFYKDTSLWWIIAVANNLGNGRLSIEPGLQLRIPTNIDKIISDFNKLNS